MDRLPLRPGHTLEQLPPGWAVTGLPPTELGWAWVSGPVREAALRALGLVGASATG